MEKLAMAVTSTPTVVAQRRWLNPARREAIEGFAYIAPWMIGFLVFALGPMLASLALSFTKYDMLKPAEFIGIQNYLYLFKDRLFYQSLSRTAIYAAAIVTFGVSGSLLLAVLLNQGLIGKVAFRTMYFLPSLTPVVASALLWQWLLHPDLGLVNTALWMIGIKGPGWLTTTEWALPSLVVMALWAGLGGQRMIIFIAGLQGVPQELYEAASIDGADNWARFRNVTMPMITPTIFFNLVLSVISSFSVFTVAYVATQGGPARATYFYVYHLYNTAFQDFSMGLASALAWVFFLILLVFTGVQFRLQRLWVYYEAEEHK
jgi:multiple sugar transport system permease protein